MTKKAVIIGGGITGFAIIQELLKHDYFVYVFAIDKNEELNNLPNTKFILCDRNSLQFEKLAIEIGQNSHIDIVIDTYCYKASDFEKTFLAYKNYCNHFMILSTTLVYDRTKELGYIREDSVLDLTPLSNPNDFMNGGYAKDKFFMEQYIINLQNTNPSHFFTIFRTFHILGKGSPVGHTPPFTRDYAVFDKLKHNPLALLPFGGQNRFNLIDPLDIARNLVLCIHNPKAYNEFFNLLNPQVITSNEYYNWIGDLMNIKIQIKEVSWQEAIQESQWHFMLLDHCYNTSKLESVTKQKVALISPFESMKAAFLYIQSNPHLQKIHKSTLAMHKHMNLLPYPKIEQMVWKQKLE